MGKYNTIVYNLYIYDIGIQMYCSLLKLISHLNYFRYKILLKIDNEQTHKQYYKIIVTRAVFFFI